MFHGKTVLKEGVVHDLPHDVEHWRPASKTAIRSVREKGMSHCAWNEECDRPRPCRVAMDNPASTSCNKMLDRVPGPLIELGRTYGWVVTGILVGTGESCPKASISR